MHIFLSKPIKKIKIKIRINTEYKKIDLEFANYNVNHVTKHICIIPNQILI